jgi:hypothetical protein
MNLQIPSARAPFIDQRTGLISREWFQFLFLLSVPYAKTKPTPDGGTAILLTNKTGAASIKGYCVTTGNAANNSVILVGIGIPNCIGVFLESGVPDGSEAWIVVSGIADVYFWASTTRGYLARTGIASDTGEIAGQALSEAIPTSPFATDKHFCEIGHVLETRTGAGLAKVVLHFN